MNSKLTVIVICPGNVTTGGPELLHQLVHEIRLFGQEAYICYYPFDGFFAIPEVYKKYNVVQLDRQISDKDIVIIPETLVKIAFQIKNKNVFIWWLSVDNFLGYSFKKRFFQPLIKQFRKIRNAIIILRLKRFKHLVQSHYAYNFLRNRGICANFLSDYIDYPDNEIHSKTLITDRRNIILFNPKKGSDTTKLLIESFPQFQFFPIIGLSPKEVFELFLTSKIYIDFGHHPGKDRLPREAVLAGCCVITGRRGSALHNEDLPIPEKFKLDDIMGINREHFRLLVESIFDDYIENYTHFQNYLLKTRSERKVFNREVNRFLEFCKNCVD